MSTFRTHITLPDDVLADLKRLVDKRQRSRFIAEAVRKELLIARQKAALRAAAGSWKDKDHPELKGGTHAGSGSCAASRRRASKSSSATGSN